MSVRIGIAGIAGRMGQVLVEECGRAGLVVAGGFDRAASDAAPRFASIAALAGACDVVIDFTHASAVRDHAEMLAAAGTAWVLGTSGITEAGQAAVDGASARIAIVQAANFSPGVNLVIALAERLAAALPADGYDAEIIEMHHRQKVDAPSGTALALGDAVARGRGVRLADVRESGRDGQHGARKAGAIGFASLRGGQIVGEHTLVFAAAAEMVELTHRAFDRRTFAAGAVRAAAWVAGREPGLYGMPDVLATR